MPINRESTAIQTIPISVVSILRRESENVENIAISLLIDIWCEPGPTLINRGSIANQSRISSRFFENWTDQDCSTLNFVVLILLCISFLLAITIEHSADQCRPQYVYDIKQKCDIIFMPYIRLISPRSYNSWFFYNTCLSQSRTNRRSIAMQGVTIPDAEIHIPFYNSWTCTYDRLPNRSQHEFIIDAIVFSLEISHHTCIWTYLNYCLIHVSNHIISFIYTL